jgi:hypothetical protein
MMGPAERRQLVSGKWDGALTAMASAAFLLKCKRHAIRRLLIGLIGIEVTV